MWFSYPEQGGGRATKGKMALAVFPFVRLCKSQLLSGACVSPKQDNYGKYWVGHFITFLV